MPAPVLGRTWLGWCQRCNVPVVGKACSRCGSGVPSVQLTPPADTRPAFPWDVAHINRFFEERYGAPLLRTDRVAVLSSTAGFETAYEVIADGRKLAIIGSTAAGEDFTKLYLDGAQRLADAGGRGGVDVAEDVVRFLEHGDLLRPGVDAADPAIERGQDVYVRSGGRAVATGAAQMGGAGMATRGRGIAVKVRHFGAGVSGDLGPSSWEGAVEANARRLDELERAAVGFIRRTAREHAGRPLVAMSGGKDSMATLILASKALDDLDVVFVDTGLEFPETVECVGESCRALGLEGRLHVAEAGDAFWRNLRTFGPPAMNYRWCCKVTKLGPVSRLIRERWGATLTYGGERRYESFSRAGRPPVDRNPWVPNQLCAYPILQWTGLDVWLYLMREGAPTNPLYHQGHERVGCWLCPSSSAWEFARLRETHPELAARWDGVLREHAERHGLGAEWVSGGWRREGHGERGAPRGGMASFAVTADRTAEGGALEAAIEGWEDTHLLGALGEVDRAGGGVSVRAREGTLEVAPNGRATVSGEGLTRGDGEGLLRRACALALRERACTGCGICVSACRRGALSFRGRLMLDDARCTRCGACLAQSCPLDFLADGAR